MVRRRMEGLALLLAVGVLAVLGLVATVFVSMTQMERRSSRQRIASAQALLLARSGVEDALARVCSGQDPSEAASRFRGEDWDASDALDGVEVLHEIFAPGTLDREACPVRSALRPSFFVRDPASLGADGRRAPVLNDVDGKLRGRSGTLSQAACFAVRIDDESAKIHVNGGLLDDGDRDADGTPDHRDGDVRTTAASDTGTGWNRMLGRILATLGAQTDIGIPTLGSDILANRPKGGYASIEDLQKRLGITKDLSPYLTTRSWIDTSVVHPTAVTGQLAFGPIGIAQNSRYKRCTNYEGYSDLKRGQSPLRPEEGGRAPVNLNAATRPVLYALVRTLEGLAWGNLRVGTNSPATKHAFTAVQAGRIVDAIMDFRDGRDPGAAFAALGLTPAPFRTRNDFETFVDALCPGWVSKPPSFLNTGTGGMLCALDMLKANFDPNTRLQKDLPDQLVWRWVDKSDLVSWTTEGCFEPTGSFRAESVGRIVDARGRLLAERRVAADIEAYRLLRQTTQADFVAGRANPQDYLALSTATLYLTHGAQDGASPCSWHVWPSPRGLGVVTTPCPPTALPGNAAAFDGAVTLATVQVPPVHPNALAGDRLYFLHHFDDSWDADRGANRALKSGDESGFDSHRLQRDLTQSTWPASAAIQPNTLLPDGMHAQGFRLLQFNPAGILPVSWTPPGEPSNHGVLMHWIKVQEQSTDRLRGDFQLCRFEEWLDPNIDFTFLLQWDIILTQSLMLGRNQGSTRWGVLAEAAFSDSDTAFERTAGAYPNAGEVLFPGMRWRLATALFDTDEAVGNDLQYDLRGVAPPSGFAPDVSNYPDPYILTGKGDMLDPAWPLGMMIGGGHAVMDEFAVYDFGDTATTAWGKAMSWADDRYADGRYYKQGDASFLSVTLEPDAGRNVRLLKAAWTGYLPQESRKVFTLSAQNGTPRVIDPVLQNDPVTGPRLWFEVDLVDPASPTTVLRKLGQGAGIGMAASELRYLVRFKTALEDPLNDPLLETPYFDDITFFWQGAEGPRLTGWSGR